MVGRTVTNDLSPERFHNRLPFFAKVHEYDPATNSTVSGTPTFVLRCLSRTFPTCKLLHPARVLECSSAHVVLLHSATCWWLGAEQCMQHHALSQTSDIEFDTLLKFLIVTVALM